MTRFNRAIRPYVDRELRASAAARAAGDPALAFRHLERAHVLGQAATLQHLRAHGQMLLWSLHQHDWPECAGQLLRLFGALTKTALGLIPTGNTGGSHISPFKRLPVPDDLAQLIQQARQAAR